MLNTEYLIQNTKRETRNAEPFKPQTFQTYQTRNRDLDLNAVNRQSMANATTQHKEMPYCVHEFDFFE